MKTLCLLRHARTSRRIDQQDFDRPLAPAGFEAAHRMAEILRAENLVPGLVLCSGARRARETWEAVEAQLDPDDTRRVSLDLRDDLYLASHLRLLTALRGLPDTSNAVLVIAHNPGLQRLAGSLAGPASRQGALAALSRGYPPAGLAVLSFMTEHWAEVVPGAGRLERFLDPAALAAG
jgi:phosphohistidine phosphatase